MGLDNSCNLPIISFSRSAPLSGWRMVKVARELHIAKRSPRPLLLVAKAKVPKGLSIYYVSIFIDLHRVE